VTSALGARAALSIVLLLGAAAAFAAPPQDTIVMGKGIDDIVSLDPAEVYEASGGEVVGNLYDRLLEIDPRAPGHLRPGVALSWQVGADGRTYTFALRADAHFADGGGVTAADAAFSIERVLKLGKAPALVLQQLGLTRDNVDDRVRAEGEHTLVIVTPYPVAPSLVFACLTAAVASVVDRRVVMAHAEEGDLGNFWLASHSAGSGPYRLRVWRPAERYTLDANDAYWGGAPANRRVIVRHIKEAATQRLMLMRGDIDYARDLDKDQLDALAGTVGIRIDRGVQNFITYLALNQRNPYLRRPEVIAALKLLVDYDGMGQAILGGMRIVHQGFEPQGFLGAIDDRPFRYDPARAKALLAQAGLGDGFDVTIDVRNAWPAMDLAQAMQASFAAAGVRLTIIPGDGKQVLTKYRARHHDIFLGDWGPDYPDPHSNAEAFIVNDDNSDGAAKKTPAWRNSWSDPEMSAHVAAAMAEPDPARRAELYGALQRRHQQEAPFVFLFQHVEVAAHLADVDGFVIGPSAARNRYAGIAKH
jgi:peptide/nickel transport system substrate-binding protein